MENWEGRITYVKLLGFFGEGEEESFEIQAESISSALRKLATEEYRRKNRQQER